MSPVHQKVVKCVGLLGSAIRKLTTACLCDRISPAALGAALENIYDALKTLTN